MPRGACRVSVAKRLLAARVAIEVLSMACTHMSRPAKTAINATMPTARAFMRRLGSPGWNFKSLVQNRDHTFGRWAACSAGLIDRTGAEVLMGSPRPDASPAEFRLRESPWG